MNNKQQSPVKKLLAIRGMGAALTAFVGLVIIYIAFGLINSAVFSGQNILNLLRSMSKYLLIGIAQSYVLITGNIDLSIGSLVGMSAMISATLMTTGMNPLLAILISLLCCLVIGVVNGYLVGKFKLPPFIATLGTMFVARGIAYMIHLIFGDEYGMHVYSVQQRGTDVEITIPITANDRDVKNRSVLA